MAASRASIGFAGFDEDWEFGMICRCLSRLNPKLCSMHTDSLVFVPRLVFAVSSVTPRRALLHLLGAQKNCLRLVRHNSPGLLRPRAAAGARSLLWRHAHLPGLRGAPGGVSKLRQSEARATGVFGRQPVLHQALCLLRGAALS